MDKPEEPQPKQAKIAGITLAMDLETLQLDMKIVVPNLGIALDMARRAVDEIKREIDFAWNEQRARRPVIAAAAPPWPHGRNGH